MTITSWRIVKRRYANHAFNGEGARRFGGRWNHRGTSVVYTAQSPSLAALELLIHLNHAELLKAYIFIPVTFPETLVEEMDLRSLPFKWKNNPASRALADLGGQWFKEGRFAVLRVPSAVIDMEFNYLLNPIHRDFVKIAVGKARPFQFDRRLMK